MVFLSGRLLFLAFLYFLQGLPYGLQSRFLPIYFRTHGMTLSSVGFFKLLLAPWMCKALWAPLVDHYGTKKLWLMYSMIGLVITCILGAFSTPDLVFQLALVLFMFNLLTSTQDIAVDGLAIQILATSELASGNIAQVVGYKLGAIFSGGLLTWLSEYFDWGSLFITLAVVYFLAFVNVLTVSPGTRSVVTETDITKATESEETHIQSTEHWLIEHFKMILASEETRWTFVYVLLYKLGEQGALSMLPLFFVDKGISTASIGFWTGTVGQVISIGGSFYGGILVSGHGYSSFSVVKLFSQLRVIYLAFIFGIVFYWSVYPDHMVEEIYFAAAVIGMCLMLLGSGIVTTTTFTMMMYCSQRAPAKIQASHYTTLATIEVLGKLTFSVLIGSFTDLVGYVLVFLLFIILSILVLPVLKKCPKTLTEMSNIENKNS